MINNRQNGRRRGRGGGNNNGQRSGNPGSPNSGNRIDNRARGNANQLYEKYKNLARDAQMSGDRVNTEYYLQFADHYFRVLSESRMRFEEQNPNAPQQRRIQPVDSFDDFDDGDDYGDEGEPIRAGEQDRGGGDYQQGGQQGGQQAGQQNGQQGGQYGQRRDGQRDNGHRESAQRDNGQRDNGQRESVQRESVQRDSNQRDDRDQPRAPRQDARRDDRGDNRGDGARFDARRGVPDGDRAGGQDRYAAPTPIANDLGDEPARADEPASAEPRRRGRPRRVEAEAQGAPAALDVDRLPPALSVGPAGNGDDAGDDGDAPRPRRRRVRAASGEASTLG